ncbi:MAG: hypothetical protein SFV32_06965 [Opitutaceae bacterium]|nr:hypothetical protein [Opitutaceae bacterium]
MSATCLPHRILLLGLCLYVAATTSTRGQFVDEFEGRGDPAGWSTLTGDGEAVATVVVRDGIARFSVDATHDKRGIWWAILRREIGSQLDWAAIANGKNALRVEARVRASEPIKRVNLSFNTPRTRDYHRHLLEFELEEANHWYTLSMTVDDLDLTVPEAVNVQLAMMDWGLGSYSVEIDSIRVMTADPRDRQSEGGNGLPYHPPIPDDATFELSSLAAEYATLDSKESGAVLDDWSVVSNGRTLPGASVGGNLRAIFRWDLSEFRGKRVNAVGTLTLTTLALSKTAAARKDFGMVRVVEMIGGPADWSRSSISWNSLIGSESELRVFNSQMIIDGELGPGPRQKARFTIPAPVLQRLIDGRSKGIALLPLGSLQATVAASGEDAPLLRFSTREP